jgi:hypothetical protein
MRIAGVLADIIAPFLLCFAYVSLTLLVILCLCFPECARCLCHTENTECHCNANIIHIELRDAVTVEYLLLCSVV